MQPVENVFVLPRAQVALYLDDGDGNPGAQAIAMKQLEQVRVTERFTGVRTNFTGLPYARNFHMLEEYEISAEGLWDVARVMERNTLYILTMTLRAATFGDGTAAKWCRIYYFGASTDASDMNTRDSNEFVGSVTITANRRALQPVSGSNVGTPSAPIGCDDL